MRHGQTIDLTYDGDISETINFWRDKEHLHNNWDAARQLCQALETVKGPPTPAQNRSNAWIWEGADHELILAFLRSYTEHEASQRVKTSLLADYIVAEVAAERLKTWTVLLASGEGPPPDESLTTRSLQLVQRSWHGTQSGEVDQLQSANHYRIRRLLNPVDEAGDLTEQEYREALDVTLRDWEANPWSRSDPSVKRKKPEIPSGPGIREARPAQRGLLLLYPLDGSDDADHPKVEQEAVKIPVIGFGVSFPKVRAGTASKVQYRVNNVYYKQEVLGLPQDLDW
jgi:hypothetical protein